MKLKRARAGCYIDTLADGRFVSVEWLVTGYGDSGWVWWIDTERSDFPVATKGYCIELLEKQLQSEGR